MNAVSSDVSEEPHNPSTSLTKKTFYCKDKDFCVYGRPDGVGNIVFTIHCSQPGWAGVGIGKSMIGAEVRLNLLHLAHSWLDELRKRLYSHIC
jgi:hypothetical protein